jgi:hypothetical protein
MTNTLRNNLNEAKAIDTLIEASRAERATIYTPFMRFWYALNVDRKDHGLPEANYGEARDLWQIAQEL